MVKNRKFILEIVSITLIPFAVFWILFRYGFWKIIDSLAVAVLICVLIYFVLRFLFRQKVFSFGGKS